MKTIIAYVLGAVFILATNPSVAADNKCEAGAPRGMEAFAKGIVVRVCPENEVFVDDDLVSAADAIDFIQTKVRENPRKPITIFLQAPSDDLEMDSLLELLDGAPKGSGFFFMTPDGQFFGGVS